MTAEFLTGVDVRYVDLNDGQLAIKNSVENRVANLREGSGIDDDSAGVISLGLYPVDDCTFVVRLEECDFNAKFFSARRDTLLNVCERD